VTEENVPRSEHMIIPADDNSIKFNSILYYLCAESTATRPITDTAQHRNIIIIKIIIIIKYNNSRQYVK
jgi:hypothetical protein